MSLFDCAKDENLTFERLVKMLAQFSSGGCVAANTIQSIKCGTPEPILNLRLRPDGTERERPDGSFMERP